MLKFTEIILKYLEDDAITLRSVFSTGIIVLDTLPLYIYYEPLVLVEPSEPVEPLDPVEPVEPLEPIEPLEPVESLEP